MMLKAIIVDDETFARDDLRQVLLFHPSVNVVCEAGTIEEARDHLARHRLDLVFLDIQLRGGTGFDLLPFIGLDTKVIFITAYAEYAVRAFRVNALDYILKPVTQERLAESISRLSFKKKPPMETPHAPLQLTVDDRVYIKTDTHRCLVPVKDIATIRSIGGNYVRVETRKGERMTCRKTFKEWEAILPGSLFLRIHQSAIINLRQLERFEQEKSGGGKVFLSGTDEPLEVSIRKAAGLKKRMA